MSASVVSGFAPAAAPVVSSTGGVAASPETDVGDPNLFAALLALLGPTPPADPAAAPATDGVVPPTFSLPTGTPNPTPMIDIADLPNAADAMKTETGRALLKDLGKALLAVNDALANGQPVDPAQEKKLHDTLDALAALIGVPTAPPPPVDPGLSAAASGEALLPIPESAPVLPAGGAPVAEPEPTPPSADVPPDVDAAAADAVATPAPAAAPAASEAAPKPAARLVDFLEHLSAALQQRAPELAEKLDVLAKKLASGTDVHKLLEQLGLGSDKAAADPAIDAMVATLAAARPAKAATAPAPFTAPALPAPTDAVATGDATPLGAVPQAPAPAGATDLAADAPADTAKPVLAVHLAADDKPAAPDSKAPPAPPAPVASDQPATPSADAAANAATPQGSAAPAVAGARAIHAAYQAPVQQLNLPQVAFEVARQFSAGNSRFQIRLDPPELGRIDVRLDVDKQGTVNARMTVERAETLDLMQRDHRALQQALQQAGLDSSRTNLEFSLRQSPFARDGSGGDGGRQPFLPFGDGTGADSAPEIAPTTLYRGTASAGGVNLFV